MEAVLAKARLASAYYNIFIVIFRKTRSAHAIGIRLDGALHFFDSNIGEFAFPDGSRSGNDWRCDGLRATRLREWPVERPGRAKK